MKQSSLMSNKVEIEMNVYNKDGGIETHRNLITDTAVFLTVEKELDETIGCNIGIVGRVNDSLLMTLAKGLQDTHSRVMDMMSEEAQRYYATKQINSMIKQNKKEEDDDVSDILKKLFQSLI